MCPCVECQCEAAIVRPRVGKARNSVPADMDTLTLELILCY
jgi:hypothetical protein